LRRERITRAPLTTATAPRGKKITDVASGVDAGVVGDDCGLVPPPGVEPPPVGVEPPLEGVEPLFGDALAAGEPEGEDPEGDDPEGEELFEGFVLPDDGELEPGEELVGDVVDDDEPLLLPLLFELFGFVDEPCPELELFGFEEWCEASCFGWVR
jgi:hypothetical protein